MVIYASHLTEMTSGHKLLCQLSCELPQALVHGLELFRDHPKFVVVTPWEIREQIKVLTRPSCILVFVLFFFLFGESKFKTILFLCEP